MKSIRALDQFLGYDDLSPGPVVGFPDHGKYDQVHDVLASVCGRSKDLVHLVMFK